MTLKIYFDWNDLSKEPSSYDRTTNIIQVNPYFHRSYPSWFWFVPLIHEVGHWLIDKIVPEYEYGELVHIKLDGFHEWFISHLTGKEYFSECDRWITKLEEEDKK